MNRTTWEWEDAEIASDAHGTPVPTADAQTTSTVTHAVIAGDVIPLGRTVLPRFTRRRDDVQAIRVTWANWPQLQTFLAEQNVTVQRYDIAETQVSDTCGEPGPFYIAFVIQLPSGKEIEARHGDWVIRGRQAREFLPCPPQIFDILFEEWVPTP